MEGMQCLKLYQIDLEFLIQTLEPIVINAIMSEVEQKRNYEQFSFNSVANKVNYLMNHSIECYIPIGVCTSCTPYTIPKINPYNVELHGVYPFRNETNTFQICGIEVYIILQHMDLKF